MKKQKYYRLGGGKCIQDHCKDHLTIPKGTKN
jgi:hypothetical protein